MARVKRGNVARNRRKKVLKITRGSYGSFSKLFRPAHQAMLHALPHMYRGRKLKKRDFRSLWIVRLSAALKPFELSYSKFMNMIVKKEVKLNRKMLSELSIQSPDTFTKVVDFVRK